MDFLLLETIAISEMFLPNGLRHLCSWTQTHFLALSLAAGKSVRFSVDLRPKFEWLFVYFYCSFLQHLTVTISLMSSKIEKPHWEFYRLFCMHGRSHFTVQDRPIVPTHLTNTISATYVGS